LLPPAVDTLLTTVRTVAHDSPSTALRDLRNRPRGSSTLLSGAIEMRDGERVRVVAIGCLLGACSYTPPTEVSVDAGGVVPPDDAPLEEPTGIVPCSSPDATGLVLCLELEDGVGDGTLLDSAPGRHHATTKGLAPVMRTVPVESPAAQVGGDAVTRVADDPVLDLAAGYTLAVWVRPDTLPAIGEPQGILDREQQYAMLLGRTPGGIVQNRCVHTGVARYEWTENLPEGAWSFLACTWDGVELCAWRWSSPNDAEHYCHAVSLLPNAEGVHGLAIGHLSENGTAHSRLVGALDSVQLYDRRLSDAQLCALVGRPAPCM
jgi:hypothetical protein